MTAGEIIVQLGDHARQGQEPTDGMEITGVGPVKVDPEKQHHPGPEARSASTRRTIDGLVELGL